METTKLKEYRWTGRISLEAISRFLFNLSSIIKILNTGLLKLVYSYVIEVVDSESTFGLYSTALVSEIIAFYNRQENALGRPKRHVQLYTLII